jgi:hypothetical protein
VRLVGRCQDAVLPAGRWLCALWERMGVGATFRHRGQFRSPQAWPRSPSSMCAPAPQVMGCHTTAAANAYWSDSGAVAAVLKAGFTVDSLLGRWVRGMGALVLGVALWFWYATGPLSCLYGWYEDYGCNFVLG